MIRRSHARSLQARLAVRLALLFVAATVLALGTLAYETYRSLASLGEQNLLVRARTLASYVRAGHRGEAVLELPGELAAVYEAPTHFAVYAIRDVAGRVIAASDAEFRGVAAARSRASREARFFRLASFGYSASEYYGVDVELETAAGPVSVAVAEAGDVDNLFHAMLEDFVDDVAWVIPVFIGVTMLVGVLAIRGGLRPVRRASEEAAMVGPGNLSARLSREDLPAEIEPLVAAMNQALDRLEEGFDAQRRFTANAAHELRTPLTIISAALETMEGNGELAKLRQDVARMSRLVAQLLNVARLDSLDLDVSADVDLGEIAADVVESMASFAIARQRSLALARRDHVIVKGNRGAIADALRNLVENAVQHTAAHTEVLVEVGEDGSLAVSDCGPGVAAQDRDRVFDRFWRGKAAQGTGAGLGLAIVAETMKTHEGRVEIGENGSRGARFTLRFRTS